MTVFDGDIQSLRKIQIKSKGEITAKMPRRNGRKRDTFIIPRC
jgi:hypothetical protein